MKLKKEWKRLRPYLKPYRIRLAGTVLLAALTVLGTLYIPILTGNALDRILGRGQVDFGAVLAIMIRVAAVALATAAAQWLMNTTNNYIVYHVIEDIRKRALHRVQKLPLSYLDTHPRGDMVSRMIANVDTFAEGLLLGFTQLFTGLMTIIGTLVFMLAANVPIALVVICLTPVSFLAARFIAKRTYHMFRRQTACRGEETALVEEILGNQKVVKAFGREKQVEERFREINDRLEDASFQAVFYSSITNPATRFVNSLVYLGVAVFGSLLALGGGITVGGLSCFLSYANQYTRPFNEISGVVAELQNALVCAGRVLDLIEEETEEPDAENAGELADVKGRISIENVSFSYRPEQPLIEHFYLEAEPGMRVAIVGPTGSGKTTLINLLMRFYEVGEGSIRVDARDVRELTRRSLRGSFGMVLQETWLRQGTIEDNIRMGRPDASPEEVREAARAAHAHSFIMRLPDGYDTVLGEDGGSLSGGQKQLLCIARVMLCLPPMLILDEATSSIDTRTEQQIQKAFGRMMKGRTSFIVAHRLSTIREADVILVMKDGHVIEQGSHRELMDAQGFYAHLYNSQYAV